MAGKPGTKTDYGIEIPAEHRLGRTEDANTQAQDIIRRCEGLWDPGKSDCAKVVRDVAVALASADYS
jgi:hypothetical protein